jgi:hypothetical protein
MKADISPMQYMRAHGQKAGPTQRPFLTGALSGLVGSIPMVAIRFYSGALASEGDALHLSGATVVVLTVAVAVLFGVIYAFVFQRAANDTRGGWMFGSGFGFLVWMLGPVGLWLLFGGQPLATGRGAMGLFAGYVVYGLTLGAVFPFINKALQKRFRSL